MKSLALFLLLTMFQSLAFEFTSVREEIPESNPVTRQLVTDGRTKFSFIAPTGWEIRADNSARKMILQPPTSTGGFIVRLSTNSVPSGAALLRSSLADRFQNVVVLDEFGAASGSGAGLGIEFLHVANSKVPATTRLAVFGTPEGLIEIALTGSVQDFEKLRPAWTGFMNSFRVESRTAQRK